MPMKPDTSGLKKAQEASEEQAQEQKAEQQEQQQQAYKKYQLQKRATSGSGSLGTQLNAGKGQSTTLGG